MTKEEIKNKITEHKECCKKLAKEYRQRYNEDKTDKLALNMFYHNVIAYNNFENILAMIEDRNSMMLCFAEPPILTEKTVEVDINRIADLEKENAELKDQLTLKDEELNCVVTDFNTFKSEAKDLIRNLLRVTYGEGWNYSLQVKVEAEKFLKECK